MTIRALSFDTGGTVLDWHGGIVARLAAVCGERVAGLDLNQVANDWRRRAMKRIVGQVHPSFNMDDAHRESLRDTLSSYGLGDLNATQREAIWSVWYQLDAWSDFAPALAILRSAVPVGVEK